MLLYFGGGKLLKSEYLKFLKDLNYTSRHYEKTKTICNYVYIVGVFLSNSLNLVEFNFGEMKILGHQFLTEFSCILWV